MKILLRGGQTTIHSIRMFKQVIWSLAKIGLFIIVATTIFKIVSKIDPYHIKLIMIHYYASILIDFGIGSTIINFLNGSGDKISLPALEVVNNPLLLKIKFETYQLIKNSFKASLFISAISSILLIVIFFIRGRLIAQKRNLSGNKLVRPARLKRLSLTSNYLKGNFKLIKIAHIAYPYNASSTHTIITGASGTGKTVLMTDLVNQIRKRNKKAIIYDKMGIYTKLFYDPNKGDILLNPLDKRSPCWNIVNEGISKSDYETIAKAFIPQKAGNSDPYWENAARIVFSESLKYLNEMKMSDNSYLKEVFFESNEALFHRIINSSGLLKKILPDESEKTTGSVLSVMASYVSSLQYLDDQTRDDQDNDRKFFSIRKWIENDKETGFLIIPSKSNQHESLKPLISVALEIAINSLTSLNQSKEREIYILLDELASLHYLPSLETGLAESRQFGGNFILSLQLISQLKAVYGIERSVAISGLCRNRVVFSTPDEETARWCSSSLGKAEIEEIREGFSYGSSEIRDGINVNKHVQIRPIIGPTDIMNLENLNLYLKFSNNFPLTKQKLRTKDYSVLNQSFTPMENNQNLDLIVHQKEKVVKENKENNKGKQKRSKNKSPNSKGQNHNSDPDFINHITNSRSDDEDFENQVSGNSQEDKLVTF